MAGLADLTPLEYDVLLVLTESRSVASVVTVAVDLCERRPEMERGDPIGLVALILGGLNEKGLLTYRVTEPGSQGSSRVWPSDLPYHVRLTSHGWAFMGYATKGAEVGTSSTHTATPKYPGDRTDYRTHGHHSEGGAIERLALPEHMALYPSHAFHLPFQYGDDIPMNMKRVYTKVAGEVEVEVRDLQKLFPTMTYDAIAERLDIPVRTIKYILVDKPRLRRIYEGESPASLKAAMLRAIADEGPFDSVDALRAVIGTAEDHHNVTHVLHSLRHEGSISFKTQKQSNNQTNYTDIRLRKRASVPPTSITPTSEVMGSDVITEPEVIPPQAPEPTTQVDSDVPEMTEAVRLPVTPEAQRAGWPVLTRLLQSERDRMEGEDKAAVYLRAAESLSELDPEEAERLTAKAAAIAPPTMSPAEREYLAFAKAHLPEPE